MKRLFEFEPITVNFKAPADLIELMDAYAAATQTSRSWVIRAALQAMFTQMPAPNSRLQSEAGQ